MLVKFTSYPSDLHICVITSLIMYLACTKCKHVDNKALFISALSQFLEEQYWQRDHGCYVQVWDKCGPFPAS